MILKIYEQSHCSVLCSSTRFQLIGASFSAERKIGKPFIMTVSEPSNKITNQSEVKHCQLLIHF